MSPAANLDRRLLATVRKSLHSARLLGPESLLLVAVSGGPDSLCLLHLLTRLPPSVRPRLHVGHLDHGLRGEDSAADARFVQATTEAWGHPATIARRTTGRSENAARQARYAFLTELAENTGAQAVAIAHTAGDQAETVLLHLLRGTGLTGLSGMASDSTRSDSAGRTLRVIRPLLTASRDDTHGYCRIHDLFPRQDPTNQSPRFTRNRIRAHLLPELRTYNPRIEDALVRLATLAASEEAYWATETARSWIELAAEQSAGEFRLSVAGLRVLPPAVQRRLLRKALTDLEGTPGFSQPSSDAHPEAGHIDQILRLLKGGAGRRACLPGGIEAETEAGILILRARREQPASPVLLMTALAVPGETDAGPWHAIIRAGPPPTTIGMARWTAWLDADRIPGPLLLRSRRPGDRYRPTGMCSPKKLQDILVDAKIPRHLRDALPLLESGDAIVWLGGFRVSEDVKITSQTTNAIEVRLQPASEPARRLHALRG